jgi:hypothetical protein
MYLNLNLNRNIKINIFISNLFSSYSYGYDHGLAADVRNMRNVIRPSDMTATEMRDHGCV